MNKSKIPVPNKYSVVSSLPVPIKSVVNIKENKSEDKAKNSRQQIKLPVTLKTGISIKRKIPSKATSSSKDHKNESIKRLATLKAQPLNNKSNRSEEHVEKKKKFNRNTTQKPENLNIKRIPNPCDISKNKKEPQKFISRKDSKESRTISSKAKHGDYSKKLQSSKKVDTVSRPSSKSETKQNLQKSKNTEIGSSCPNTNEVDKVSTDVLKIKEPVLDGDLDDNDLEFKASGFYKNLILSERELSPGIMKLCADKKLTSHLAKMGTPVQRFLSSNSSNFVEELRRNSARFRANTRKFQNSPCPDNSLTPVNKILSSNSSNFVEELRRNSAKFRGLQGKFPNTPCLTNFKTPISKGLNENSSKFVEELRRNSLKFSRRKGNLLVSPHMAYKESPFKLAHNFSSSKENLDEELIRNVKNMYVSKLKMLQNSNSCSHIENANHKISSIQSNLNPNQMSATEIATKIKEFSEIRRESLFLQQNKRSVYEKSYQVNANSNKEDEKETDNLASKKKEKTKKKVTFNIPFASSFDSAKTCKPPTEMSDMGVNAIKCMENFTSVSNSLLKSNEVNTETKENITSETMQLDLTPEFNLNSTLPKSDSIYVVKVAENIQSKNQSSTPEFDLKSLDPHPMDLKSRQNPDSISFVANVSTTSPNATTTDNINDQVSPSGKLFPAHDKQIFKSSSVPNIATSVIQSFEDLRISPSPASASETKRFSVHLRNAFTPLPVSLNSRNSYSADNISPMFLTEKSADACCIAPMQTPFVLKNLAKTSPACLFPVRQKLTFSDESKPSFERRESQIILQNIPTVQKMQDVLCDQECNILSMQSIEEPDYRPLQNPIVSILCNGDDMHFVPVNSPEQRLSLLNF